MQLVILLRNHQLFSVSAFVYDLQYFHHIKPFSELLCPVYGGGVILEEMTPRRIEMFLHRMKSVELCIDFQRCFTQTEPIDPPCRSSTGQRSDRQWKLFSFSTKLNNQNVTLTLPPEGSVSQWLSDSLYFYPSDIQFVNHNLTSKLLYLILSS